MTKYHITRSKPVQFELPPGYVPSPEGQEFFEKMLSRYFTKIGQKGGRIGGRATTPAKRRASRANGKLGGRPRKDQQK